MFFGSWPRILIEFLDGTKKVQLAGKKSFLVGKKSSPWFKAFRTCFWEVDHPLCDVIGVQDFEKAKIYKPTWTKIGLRPIFVLRWN